MNPNINITKIESEKELEARYMGNLCIYCLQRIGDFPSRCLRINNYEYALHASCTTAMLAKLQNDEDALQ